MKAGITSKGTLFIAAETDTESFALMAWQSRSDGYKVILEPQTEDDDSVEYAIIGILNTQELIDQWDAEHDDGDHEA